MIATRDLVVDHLLDDVVLQTQAVDHHNHANSYVYVYANACARILHAFVVRNDHLPLACVISGRTTDAY